MKKNIFVIILSNILSVIHFLAVVFVIYAPFSNLTGVLAVNVSYTLSLLVHWYFSNDTCCLTILESYVRGVKSENTFVYKLVSPIYSGITTKLLGLPPGIISETFVSKVSWVITILSLTVSVIKIIQKSPKNLRDLFCLKNC